MDSLLDVVEDGLRDPGVARTSLDLGQTRVVETPQHRVEVIAGDPRALDVKARRLEDPQVWGVVEDGARGQIEKVLDSRGLVQFAGRGVDEGVQGRVGVRDPCRKRTPCPKEWPDRIERIGEARGPRKEGNREAPGAQRSVVWRGAQRPNVDSNRSGRTFLRMQGLETLGDPTTTLFFVSVPGAVEQGEIESRRPVRRGVQL